MYKLNFDFLDDTKSCEDFIFEYLKFIIDNEVFNNSVIIDKTYKSYSFVINLKEFINKISNFSINVKSNDDNYELFLLKDDFTLEYDYDNYIDNCVRITDNIEITGKVTKNIELFKKYAVEIFYQNYLLCAKEELIESLTQINKSLSNFD